MVFLMYIAYCNVTCYLFFILSSFLSYCWYSIRTVLSHCRLFLTLTYGIYVQERSTEETMSVLRTPSKTFPLHPSKVMTLNPQ